MSFKNIDSAGITPAQTEKPSEQYLRVGFPICIWIQPPGSLECNSSCILYKKGRAWLPIHREVAGTRANTRIMPSATWEWRPSRSQASYFAASDVLWGVYLGPLVCRTGSLPTTLSETETRILRITKKTRLPLSLNLLLFPGPSSHCVTPNLSSTYFTSGVTGKCCL